MTDNIFLQAILGVGKILLIIFVGFFFGRYPRPSGKNNNDRPYMSPQFVQEFGTLLIYLFFPALSFATIGSQVSADKLVTFSSIILWGCIQLLLATIVSKIVSKIYPDFGFEYQSSLVYTNTIALPITFFDSICNARYDSLENSIELEQCIEKFTSWAFFYNTIPAILIVAHCYQNFRNMKKKREKMPDVKINTNNDSNSDDNNWQNIKIFFINFARRLYNINIFAVIGGILIGLWPFMKHALFRSSGFLFLFGNTLRSIGGPAPTISLLLVAASLAHSVSDVDFSYECKKFFHLNNNENNNEINNENNNENKTNENNNKSNSNEFKEPDEKDIELQIMRPIKSPSITPPPPSHFTRPPVKLTLTLTILKLIGLPILLIAFFFLMDSIPGLCDFLTPDDNDLTFFYIIQFSSPPALIIVVFAAEAGLTNESKGLAFIFFWMYFACIITISLFSLFALSITS